MRGVKRSGCRYSAVINFGAATIHSFSFRLMLGRLTPLSCRLFSYNGMPQRVLFLDYFPRASYLRQRTQLVMSLRQRLGFDGKLTRFINPSYLKNQPHKSLCTTKTCDLPYFLFFFLYLNTTLTSPIPGSIHSTHWGR